MALTPDEIERRSFPLADWGYERGEVHKFLVEVAATLRYAQITATRSPSGVHRSGSSVATHDATPDAATPEVVPSPDTRTAGHGDIVPSPAEVERFITDDGQADLIGVGRQVRLILEDAGMVARDMRRNAEHDAAQLRADARREATAERAAAGTESQQTRDQARRVLAAAQEQAETILREAHQRSATIISAGESRASARITSTQRIAEQHVERVRRLEREAASRLEGLRGDLRSAIERLNGAQPTPPVLDLTRDRPVVLAGSDRPEGDEGDTSEAVAAMVRAAVERAAAQSRARRRVRARPDQDGAEEPSGARVTEPAATPSPPPSGAAPELAPVEEGPVPTASGGDVALADGR